jgi:copper homeostasis protein
MLVEVCVNSLESALNAEKAGANRIELCMELGLGGITPSYGLLGAVREQINIPVHVLIRPRSGDFVYSEYDFNIMLTDIEICKELGFEGVVSGILNPDFSIDVNRTEILLNASKEMNFTFHRAFDWVENPFEALDVLEKLGVHNILSSGQEQSAITGIDLLNQLNSKSSNCTIMPGSGINVRNVSNFKMNAFKWVHLSASEIFDVSLNKNELPMSYFPFLDERKRTISSTTIISQIVNKVKL